MADKMKILIVDDEPDTVEMLKIAIERGNYDIITANNATDGIAKARAEKPALIVLDVMMPGMNGIEACKTMKNDKDLSTIPIIMLTAMASKIPTTSFSISNGMDIEADEYFEKPVDPNQLLSRVNTMLGR